MIRTKHLKYNKHIKRPNKPYNNRYCLIEEVVVEHKQVVVVEEDLVDNTVEEVVVDSNLEEDLVGTVADNLVDNPCLEEDLEEVCKT